MRRPRWAVPRARLVASGLLPLLITAGALGAVGSVLGNPWVIGAAVLLALGAVAWLVRHHARRPPNHVEEP